MKRMFVNLDTTVAFNRHASEPLCENLVSTVVAQLSKDLDCKLRDRMQPMEKEEKRSELHGRMLAMEKEQHATNAWDSAVTSIEKDIQELRKARLEMLGTPDDIPTEVDKVFDAV